MPLMAPSREMLRSFRQAAVEPSMLSSQVTPISSSISQATSRPSLLHCRFGGSLKVEKVVLTHVRVPLVEPFRISSGAVSEKDGIVIALHSDGLTGYGESSPMAGNFYSGDTPERSWDELCNVVVPALLGRTFESPEDWNAALDKLPAGNFTKT